MAEHYRTCWVPEYGRIYSEKNWTPEKKWKTQEFIHIAQQQNEIEDRLAKECNKVLICDTSAFATSLWHERYVGFISQKVEAVSRGRSYDLYLLTDADIPFVQDGFRDGEHIRKHMHQRFLEELRKRRLPYKILSGSHELRLKDAIKVCDKLLNKF